MTGQLIRRGDRTWVIRIYQGRDDKGKRRYLNKTVHGAKKQAQAELNKLLHHRDTGTLIEAPKITLDAFLDRWLDAAVRPRVRERTYLDYRYRIDQYVRPSLGSRRLDRVTAVDVQELLNRMQSTKEGGGRGVSARSAIYVRTLLNNAFKQAVRWRMLPYNPIEGVDPPRQARREMRALGPDEARAFLVAAREDRWHALWLVLLTGGLRPSEALGLKWADVQGNELRVQRSLVRAKGGAWSLEEPKTERGRRSVTLPEITIVGLREHRRRQAEERLAAGAEYVSHDLVFATSVGKPLELRQLAGENILRDSKGEIRRHKRGLDRVLAKAGLPKLTLYQLRHSCATLLMAAGEHPKVVAERLGHSNVNLTLNVYSHVTPSMQQQAASKLEAMLG